MKSKRLIFGYFFLLWTSLSGQGLYIGQDSEMVVSGNPSILIRDGGLNNQGSYTKSGERIIFTGSVNDSIQGSTLISNNIIVNNTGGIVSLVDTLVVDSAEIGSSSGFVIAAGKFLTVNELLLNNAGVTGIILKSDNSGSASFINNSSGVSGTAEMFLNGNQWHIVSPVIPGQTIVDFLAANDSISHGPEFRAMTYYDETNMGWADYLTNTSSGQLEAGKGFLIRTSLDTMIYFEGSIQNSNLSAYAITANGSGWNSVGNPFTSSLMITDQADPVNNFLSYNIDQLDPEYAAVYVWNEQVGYSKKNRNDYVALNLLSDTAYLKPGQGFLVKAVSGGGNLDFNTSMRAHYNQTAFNKKSVGSDGKSQVRLLASDDENSASTSFYFIENASPGLDPGYDAGLFGALNNFSLYSMLVEESDSRFMIQALPDNGFLQYSIPVGLECPASSMISFIAEYEYLSESMELILEDRDKNLFTNLKEPGSSYKVEIENGMNGTGRFFLHTYNPEILDLINFQDSFPEVFSVNKELHIKGGGDSLCDLKLYDLIGRLILQKKLSDTGDKVISLEGLKQGIYIVSLNNSEQQEVKQIFVE